MELWLYRFDLVLWAGLCMFWYRSALFRPVLELSNRQSKWLLWALVAAGVLLGYLLGRRTRRNSWNVWMTVLFPYEVYTVLAYGKYVPALSRGVLWAALVLTVLYGLWVLLSPIRCPGRRRTILLRRLRAVLMGGRSIFTLCALALLAVGLNAALRGGVLLVPDEKASDGTQGEKDTISGHMEELCRLEDTAWAELTVEERLDVLQTVANIERTYLGVPHELPVGGSIMEEGLLGQYNPVTKQIALSLDHLAEDDAADVLDTVLHECYHAYQHSVVELYGQSPERYRQLQMFAAARDYVEELQEYQDGEDFTAYYTQRFEADARRYAELGVADYYGRIEACLDPAGASVISPEEAC